MSYNNNNNNNNNNYDSDDENWFSDSEGEKKIEVLSENELKIAALFSEELEKITEYPAGYSDVSVMTELLPELKTRSYNSYRLFSGIPWRRKKSRNDNIEYLSELIPELVKFVEDEFDKRMMREKEEDIKVLISEKDSPRKSLPRLHIGTQKNNLCVALGQYFRYIRLVESYHRDTTEDKIKISVIMLLDITRIKGFIKFLGLCYDRPRTKRNKVQNLVKVLKFFRSSPILVKNKAAEINAVITALNSSANYEAYKARESVSIIYKEKDLINAGNFLEKKEKVVYLSWLHRKLVERMESPPITVAEAHNWQELFIAFLTPLFAGIRREVVAGIRLDAVQIFREDNSEEDDEEEGTLVITPGVEKRIRSKDDKIPVPNMLKPLFIFFISVVRPILTKFYKFCPKSLWISRNGSALEFKSFSNITKKITKQFNPLLSLTPIQWRRMFITEVFANRLETNDTLDSFINDLSDYLNVTPKVMNAHYSRASKFTENKKVQNVLLKEISKDLDESYKQSQDLIAGLDTRLPLYSGKVTPRIARTDLDDKIWKKKYNKWNEERQKKLSSEVAEEMENKEEDKDDIDDNIQLSEDSDTPGSLKDFIISDDDDELTVEEIEEVEEEEEEESYEVETILKKKMDFETNTVLYLVKWRGYNSDEATWEPLVNLGNCLGLINSYEIETEKPRITITEVKKKDQ